MKEDLTKKIVEIAFDNGNWDTKDDVELSDKDAKDLISFAKFLSKSKDVLYAINNPASDEDSNRVLEKVKSKNQELWKTNQVKKKESFFQKLEKWLESWNYKMYGSMAFASLLLVVGIYFGWNFGGQDYYSSDSLKTAYQNLPQKSNTTTFHELRKQYPELIKSFHSNEGKTTIKDKGTIAIGFYLELIQHSNPTELRIEVIGVLSSLNQRIKDESFVVPVSFAKLEGLLSSKEIDTKEYYHLATKIREEFVNHLDMENQKLLFVGESLGLWLAKIEEKGGWADKEQKRFQKSVEILNHGKTELPDFLSGTLKTILGDKACQVNKESCKQFLSKMRELLIVLQISKGE